MINKRARLDQALKFLLKYSQGSPAQITFVGDSAGDKPKDVEESIKNVADLAGKRLSVYKSDLERLGSDFFKAGEYYPTVGALVDRQAEIVTSTGHAASSSDQALVAGFNILAYSVDGPMTAGSRNIGTELIASAADWSLGVGRSQYGVSIKDERNYSDYSILQDALLYSGKQEVDVLSGKQCPIYAIQTYNPNFEPSSIDADVVSILMNTVPGFEKSRAIPFLNIEFLSNRKASSMTSTLGITTSRFLLGKEKPEDYKGFIEAPWLTGVSNVETFEGLTTDATMDIFTSPQTMVSVNSDLTAHLDPFRPLMSVESFETKIESPKAGVQSSMSKKTGQLTLVLHEKKRMHDVAEMLQPGGLSIGTALRITWGWAHPDGNLLHGWKSGPDGWGSSASIWGDLIDGNRISEIFTVSNINFNVTEQGEVKITVPLMSQGNDKSLKTLSITDAFIDNIDTPRVMRDLETLRALLKLKSKKRKLTKLNRSTLIVLAGGKPVRGASRKKNAELIKHIKTMKKQLMGKADVSKGDLGVVLANLLETGASEDPASSIKAQARDHYVKQVLALLKKRSSDPFGNARPAGMPKVNNLAVGFEKRGDYKKTGQLKWITLGQLMVSIVGSALAKEYATELAEIQIIFHGFNESAAGVQDFNICSFPILFSQFENVLKSEVKKQGDISLESFINILNDNFISDEASYAYGIKNPTVGRKKISQEKALNRIYGLDDDYPAPRFVVPKLQVAYDIRPGTKNMTNQSKDNSTSRPVLRMHISDANAGLGGTEARLIESIAEGSMFFPLQRQAGNKTQNSGLGQAGFIPSMNHEYWATQALEPFLPHLSKITDDKKISAFLDSIKNAKQKKKLEDYLTKIKEHAFIVNMNPDSLKRALYSIYPTLVYGGNETGIISAKISTIQDKSTVDLAISRRSTSKKALNAAKTLNDPEAILSVYPVKVALECIGCPFFTFGQKFFLDFGTETDVDNVYTVTGVTHSLKPGGFTTSVDFTLPNQTGQFRTTALTIGKLLSTVLGE